MRVNAASRSKREVRCSWLSLATTTLLLLATGLSQSGCVTNTVARKLVRAPNLQMKQPWSSNANAQKFLDRAVAQKLRIQVGPPDAFLAADVIEPGYYKLEHTVEVKPDGDRHFKLHYDLKFEPRDTLKPPPPFQGTVVLLHGVFMTKETMLHWGLYFAECGYRAILVDLRGHGHSSGKWITYGAIEAKDMMQVADELERRGLANHALGVVGMSYGAAVGIHWAARDPRVKALVALQPFSDVDAAIIGVARGSFGEMTKTISDKTFHEAIRRAPAMANFTWADVDVLADVRRLKIPLLIYHGETDDWVAPAQSQAIAALAPPGSQLHILPGEHHATISVRLDPLAVPVVEWIHVGLNAPLSSASK